MCGEPGDLETRVQNRRTVRWMIVPALVAACVLAGCKEPAPTTSTEIAGSTNVEMHSYKYVPTQSSNTSSGTNDQFYVICKLTFTNTLGYDTAPLPKNFTLQDSLGNQFTGVDSGDAALIGISNYAGVVKKDEKQDYTVAFRIPPNTSGQVFYSPF
jgi:hypothetical protein